MASIGENVKELRERKGLNQTQLADRLIKQRPDSKTSWNQKTVSRIEGGQDLTVSQLEELIGIFGPHLLATTNLGAMTSSGFAELYNELQVQGAAARAELALDSLNKAEEHLRALLDAVGAGHGIDQEEG